MKPVAITGLFVLFNLLLTPVLAEGVYTWIDKHGVKQYGDSPPANVKATSVKMPELTVIKNYAEQWQAEEQGQAVTSPIVVKEAQPVPQVASYKQLSIIAPKQGQAIRANDGEVTVMVSVDPKLKAQHSFELILDGKKVSNSKSRALNLSNLGRGEHVVQVNVRDAHGKTVFQGERVSFSVLRHSKLFERKNNQPTIRNH